MNCSICNSKITEESKYFPFCCDNPKCWCPCMSEYFPYKCVTYCSGCDQNIICKACGKWDYDLGLLCENCYTTTEKLRSMLD